MAAAQGGAGSTGRTRTQQSGTRQQRAQKRNTYGFNPSVSLGVNINANRQNSGNTGGGMASGMAAGAGRGTHQFVLPEPVFNSSDDLMNYANTVKALMLVASMEMQAAAVVLQAALAEVPAQKGEGIGAQRFKAAKVARRLKRAAASAVAVAKNTAAMQVAFQREYGDNTPAKPQRRPQFQL